MRQFAPRMLLSGTLVAALAWKLSFYFSADPITGWDTVGHLHLTYVFRDLLRHFDSIGYDTGWFLGMPAFYFYPPFFYFFAANLSLILPGPSMELAYNLSIFLVIIFFCYSFFKFSGLLTPERDHPENHVQSLDRYLIQISALFLYLSYPGDGLQGVSLTGVLDGTFISTLGTAWILLSFYHIESYRRKRNHLNLVYAILTSSLLYYTHFLSSFFFLMILTIYFLWFRRSFSVRSIALLAGIPLLIASPIFYPLLRFTSYSTATAINNYYPFLLSRLGTDFFAEMAKSHASPRFWLEFLLIRGRLLDLATILFFFFGFMEIMRSEAIPSFERLLYFLTIPLLVLSLDISMPYIVPFLPVHWYRTVDLFWVFFSILSIQAIQRWADILPGAVRTMAIPLLAALLILRFWNQNPVQHEHYENMDYYKGWKTTPATMELEAYLRTIPQNAVVLPEIIRDRSLQGSPHSADLIILKSGHRNAFGLTVESSLTPITLYPDLLIIFPDFFIWGMIPSQINRAVTPNDGSAISENQRMDDIARRLSGNGIDYVLTRTSEAQARLQKRPISFQLEFTAGPWALFRIGRHKPGSAITLLKSKPLGYIDIRTLALPGRSSSDPGPRSFLDRIAELRQTFPILNHYRIVNLADSRIIKGETRDGSAFSGFIADNRGSTLANAQDLNEFLNTGLPVFSTGFRNYGPSPRNLIFLDQPEAKQQRTFLSGIDQQSMENIETPRSIEPQIFDGRHIVAKLPESMNRLQSAVTRTGQSEMGTCNPLLLYISYFPDWKPANGDALYQTDNNLTYTCIRGTQLYLKFAAPLSKIRTLLMYMLTLLLAAFGLMNAVLNRIYFSNDSARDSKDQNV